MTVEPPGTEARTLRYTVYASTDAGRTWEARSSGTATGTVRYAEVALGVVPGHTAPLDLVELDVTLRRYPGDTPIVDVTLSGDGGRSFNKAGERGADAGNLQLVHTQEGILRLYYSRADTPGGYTLSLSTDGGRTWAPMALPGYFRMMDPLADPPYTYLTVALAAPANVFLTSFDLAYSSPDGGHTWQPLPLGTPLQSSPLSPYLPLQMLYVEGSRLLARELPDAERFQPARAPLPTANGQIPGGLYIPQTGHSLRGVFKAYWDTHGGLAQFGYPRTDAFPEVNSADGRVYLVQYFERARMEYHPEFAGSRFEMELGLLGNELTSDRRIVGDAPFRPVADPYNPSILYVAATGHTLRGPFRAYWETHGGLDLYGYPISEPFAEVNPDDGQTYTVQYFERNRFEYHPGAPPEYQVLLGLLGNTLIKTKGWEP